MPSYDIIKCCVCGVVWSDHDSESPECNNRKPNGEIENSILQAVKANQEISIPNDKVIPEFNPNVPEPMPTASDWEPSWDYSIRLFRENNPEERNLEKIVEAFGMRDEMGRQKYGHRLAPFNGRNTLIDIFQELSDAYVYTNLKVVELLASTDPSNHSQATNLQWMSLNLEKMIIQVYNLCMSEL